MGTRKRETKNAIELVVLTSDHHCGSSLALMPDSYTDPEGTVHTPNPVQKIINAEWAKFVSFAREVVGDDPYACVFNGDCIEGNHHGGSQLVVKESGSQAAMFVQCVTPLVEPEQCRKVFLVEGTECHTKDSETWIGVALNAPPSGKNSYAHKELHLDICGCHCAFWHHMPTSSRFHLSSGQLSIQYSNAVSHRAAWGFPVPKLICAGHRHVHGKWEYGNGGMVVTGAWQARTRFGHKVAPGCIEAFSGVVLDWRGKPSGSMPTIHEFVAPLEPPRPVKL